MAQALSRQGCSGVARLAWRSRVRWAAYRRGLAGYGWQGGPGGVRLV